MKSVEHLFRHSFFMSVCLTFPAFVFVSLSVLYNVAACGGFLLSVVCKSFYGLR